MVKTTKKDNDCGCGKPLKINDKRKKKFIKKKKRKNMLK